MNKKDNPENHRKEKPIHLKYKISTLGIDYYQAAKRKVSIKIYTQEPQFKTLYTIQNFGKQK